MKEVVFSLKKKKGTEELHIFTAILYPDGSCEPDNYSICKKMQLMENIDNIFVCLSEENAIKKCEQIGNQVCETCVSYLYVTF